MKADFEKWISDFLEKRKDNLFCNQTVKLFSEYLIFNSLKSSYYKSDDYFTFMMT